MSASRSQRLDEESALATLAIFEQLGVLDEEFGDGFALAAKQAGIAESGGRFAIDVTGGVNTARA